MTSSYSHRRNIPPNKSPSYLKKCVYDPVSDPLCPIIRLGTIVKEAGEDYNKLAYKVLLLTKNKCSRCCKVFWLFIEEDLMWDGWVVGNLAHWTSDLRIGASRPVAAAFMFFAGLRQETLFQLHSFFIQVYKWILAAHI